jgi:hypothetical protein
MSERVPFNRLDMLIYHFDQTPDLWSVRCEVRVGGRLDPSRLAAARSGRSGATRWAAPGWNPSAP